MANGTMSLTLGQVPYAIHFGLQSVPASAGLGRNVGTERQYTHIHRGDRHVRSATRKVVERTTDCSRVGISAPTNSVPQTRISLSRDNRARAHSGSTAGKGAPDPGVGAYGHGYVAAVVS